MLPGVQSHGQKTDTAARQEASISGLLSQINIQFIVGIFSVSGLGNR